MGAVDVPGEESEAGGGADVGLGAGKEKPVKPGREAPRRF